MATLCCRLPLQSLVFALYRKDLAMATTIGSKGQITVPVHVREALGLFPGTKMKREFGSKGTFVAHKAEEGSFFSKFHGVGKPARMPWRGSSQAMEILRGRVTDGDVD